jgi:hypothetical protein
MGNLDRKGRVVLVFNIGLLYHFILDPYTLRSN